MSSKGVTVSRFLQVSAAWDSRRPGHVAFFSPEVVARDKTENKPRSSNGASERTADLGFPDAWVIADGDLNDAETPDGSL